LSHHSLHIRDAFLFFFLMIPPPPTSPLFPSTTLFRSIHIPPGIPHAVTLADGAPARMLMIFQPAGFDRYLAELAGMTAAELADRSEEHTSELQSLTNLVCRLLLEKKKRARTCAWHADS